MITAQEIREKVFEKAVFGGYDMTQVDEFMAEVANDLALLHKENSTLKAKMKVLAAKVAENRDNEEALRMAVVSAQKMGAMIEADAKTKSETMLAEAQARADALIADAEQQADVITGDAKRFLEGEETRLAEAKRESAKFIENMNLLCRRQLSFLEKVGEMDFVQELRAAEAAEDEEEAAAPEEAPAEDAEPTVVRPDSEEVHEAVRSIEETVARALDAPENDVRPDLAAAVAEDEMPTRTFNPVGEAEDGDFQLQLEEIGD